MTYIAGSITSTTDFYNVKAFGAVGDGTTDDRAAIQEAIDTAESSGGGTVVIPHTSSYYRIRLALRAKSGVTVWVPNNATRIVCTADGTGAEWPIYSIWQLSGFIPINYARATAYAASNVSTGDETATTTTAGDAASFAVGDVIAIETTSAFTVGSYNIPTWLQLNVVTSVDSGTGIIGLRKPITQTRTGIQIRQLTTSLTALTSSGASTTYPLKPTRDFAIYGGTWENTERAAAFCAGGGAIDCVIKPHKVIAGQGCAYGNLYAHCLIGEEVLIASRNAVELAWGSHHNIIDVGSISVNDDYTTGNPTRIVGLNEASNSNVVKIGNLDIGNSAVSEDVVQIVNAYRNVVEIGTIGGVSCGQAVIEISRTAYTGTNVDAHDNVVSVGTSNIGSQGRYVQISTTNSYRNRVSGNFYGTAVNDAISVTSPDNVVEGYFENGAISITSDAVRNVFRGRIGTGLAHTANFPRLFDNKYETSTDTYATLKALGYIIESSGYTSASGLTKTTTFPAGTLRQGDVLKFRARGVGTGAVGTKTISFTFAGSSVASYTIPSGTQQFDIDIELTINSNTVIAGQAKRLIGTGMAAVDVGITGLNFTTTSYDFVYSVSVASGGDGVTMRMARFFCLRPEVEGVVW